MEKVPVGYIGYRVSTADSAGWACADCGWECPDARILQATRRKTRIRCGGCRQLIRNENDFWDVRFRKEHLPFLDEENVREASWWHATPVVGWWESLPSGMEKIPQCDGPVIPSASSLDDGDLMVHVGTKAAALDRVLCQGVLDIWLHELRIRPEATLADGIWEDEETSFPERSGQARGPWLADGVTRYLNQYEMPGSVSLLANPRTLELVSRKRLQLRPRY